MSIVDGVKDPDYFTRVLARMKEIDPNAAKNLTVRFGNLGEGKAPNYQVELVYPTRHTDHKSDPIAPSGYDEENLEHKRYTFKDVEDLERERKSR